MRKPKTYGPWLCGDPEGLTGGIRQQIGHTQAIAGRCHYCDKSPVLVKREPIPDQTPPTTMPNTKQRYWLKAKHQTAWDEVTKDEYIKAERSVGLYSELSPWEPASSAFGGGSIQGKTWEPNNINPPPESIPFARAGE